MKKCLLFVALSVCVWGCVGETTPALIPNPDPSLRKNSAQLSADAVRREYELNAPRGGTAPARADYNLMSRNFELANLSGQDWANVEVWVNQQYVVFVPKMEQNNAKRLDFKMFYDRDGKHFDTEGGKNPLVSLEIYKDGQMWAVPATLE